MKQRQINQEPETLNNDSVEYFSEIQYVDHKGVKRVILVLLIMERDSITMLEKYGNRIIEVAKIRQVKTIIQL